MYATLSVCLCVEKCIYFIYLLYFLIQGIFLKLEIYKGYLNNCLRAALQELEDLDLLTAMEHN
jgi:hypothetical protein